MIGKTDTLGKELDPFSGNHQLMLSRVVVQARFALAVRQQPLSGRPTVTVEGRYNAETQQHALHGFKHDQIALAEADADSLGLRALDRAISIEQSTQQTAMEIR